MTVMETVPDMTGGVATAGPGARGMDGSEQPWQSLHPLVGAVDGACDQVDAAAESVLWGLSDADLDIALAGCERLRAQTHALELGLIGEADQRGLGTRQGAASTAAWLRHRFRIRPGHAKQLVHTAGAATDPDEAPDAELFDTSRRTGRELLDTHKALAEGAISPEHAAVVDKVMGKVPDEISIEQAARAEADLAGYCRDYDPGTVAKLGDYMLEVMRADTLEDDDRRRHRDRTLQLNDHTGGLSGQLTREGMATLRSALDPLAAPAPGSDGEPDPRSPGQRLADALVELARRALAADSFANNHGLSHRVMVSIGLDTLTTTGSSEADDENTNPVGGESGSNAMVDDAASRSRHDDVVTFGPGRYPRWAARHRGLAAPAELEWRPLLSASTALRIACHASIQRIVLDPAGAVLDVGRERRTVTPAQFAALIARDGGCAFPGCTRPASWCIAHHTVR